jgi:nucleoside-diphosphate-sugar epimerase
MKVLVTGANGLVGSQVVDVLRQQGTPTVALLRPRSDRSFLRQHPDLPVAEGSVTEPASLDAALEGITQVIHCAGLVKALRAQDFFDVNQMGTRNLVEAIRRRGKQVQRLVHLSSLAACGPGTAAAPVTEERTPGPVSVYGRSKLAGEEEVRQHCPVDWVVLRPPAVYGPRDREFLRLFQAVKLGFLPVFGGGRQALSLVQVQDLARITVQMLASPQVVRQVYFTSGYEVVTARELMELTARVMGGKPTQIPLPVWVLWPICAGQEVISRLTGRANVLSRQKYAELAAPGWVCDNSKLVKQAGEGSFTDLATGWAETAAWYRREGWL